MNKNIKNLLSAAAVSLSLLGMASCTGDLDVKPIDPNMNTQVNPTALFNKCYANLAMSGNSTGDEQCDIDGLDGGTAGFIRQLWNSNEMTTDEAICHWSDAGIREFCYNTYDDSHPMLNGLFARLTTGISYCNQYINECGDKDATKTAEVRFLRALEYYFLMDAFGNVPFATTLEKPVRYTRAEMYAWLEKELLEIEPQMSEAKSKTSSDAGYYRADTAAGWMPGPPPRKTPRRRYNFNGKGHIWWEFRYAQAKNGQDSTHNNVGVNGLCLNIQQSKEVEEDLIKARIRAEEADQMKSAFLANMSHEIRTPLNAIVGFSELLTSDMEISPNERDEFMQVISKNSDLLLKLINDILDLSRIESGKMSFTLTNCDLNELLSHIYRTHQLLMPQGVALKIQLPVLPAIIQADLHRLTQVITNLINNAAKFTTQGYILIKYDYTQDKRWIQISVTDTGKGIPADKQAQVFERFNKLDEFAQGTGLGLAICQIIIEHFGGYITLESKEGEGSTFIVTLPYTPGLSV